MARDEAREAEVTELADRTLRDHGVRALPVDPAAIAEAKGVAVGMLSLPDKMLGFIMRCEGAEFVIGYSDRSESLGMKHFTIAHELGHFCLDGHVLVLLRAPGCHSCNPGLGGDPYEKEADQFASDLLMPGDWFRKAAVGFPVGKVGVLRMAELCRTSLTATANRYACLSPAICFSIFSAGTTIRYGRLSEPARKLFPSSDSRYMKDRPVPPNSLTHTINTNAPVAIPLDGGEGWLTDWLPEAPRIRVREEVQSLGRFGTMTMLTAMS